LSPLISKETFSMEGPGKGVIRDGGTRKAKKKEKAGGEGSGNPTFEKKSLYKPQPTPGYWQRQVDGD